MSAGFSALKQTLGRFRQAAPQRQPAERCELCGLELPAEDHAHLVEPANRRILCACDACAILFDSQQDGRYRRVPRTVSLVSSCG